MTGSPVPMAKPMGRGTSPSATTAWPLPSFAGCSPSRRQNVWKCCRDSRAAFPSFDMKKPTPDFLGILRTLVEHRVEFIVIGGVGAVLQDAPVATFDPDLLHHSERVVGCCLIVCPHAHPRTNSARTLLDRHDESSRSVSVFLSGGQCDPCAIRLAIGIARPEGGTARPCPSV